VIPLTPKEIAIRMAKRILGENRVHDHLIERGIKLRHLRDGYENYSENRDDGDSRQTLIFMADGKWMHGGLTDRLRGMTSAYKFAKEHNLDFKIYHTSPFELQEILQPNNVNWVIGEKEISRNCEVAKPVLLYREDFNNDSALERQIDSKHKQFHLYSCVDTVGEDFSKYFNELFKPSPILKQELSHYSELLGESYTAISFRFQNKLGDFKEFTFKELPENGKRKLMSAAINVLRKEMPHQVGHDRSDATLSCPPVSGHPPLVNETSKILVTADSPTFLAAVENMPNVVTVKGKSIHIDFNSSKNATDYLKAFTEFFLISKATKAKLYRNRKYKTYPSNFPKYAALLGHVPYEIVEDIRA
jgi:hypothetical protein